MFRRNQPFKIQKTVGSFWEAQKYKTEGYATSISSVCEWDTIFYWERNYTEENIEESVLTVKVVKFMKSNSTPTTSVFEDLDDLESWA